MPSRNQKLTFTPLSSRPFVHELLILLAFVVLTGVMTWPWVLHLRSAVSDPGDPYLNAWIMWWDYFQSFHDPIHLFQAPIFYPYKYTLAYSENNYGIALIFFPLYALGLRPLTAAGLATLLGFVVSGYGAFRLTRTLTNAYGPAWVAGILFGFALYRFASLSHLNYLFSGWIPLTLEALIIFLRVPKWRRSVWLGVAFTMNALTCIHWFVLTLIPLALSGAFLLTHLHRWKDKKLWARLIVTLAISFIVLLPFLLPYERVAQQQGTVRKSEETARFSAYLEDWLAAPPINKLWHGFGPVPDNGERHLFTGLMPLFLAGSALFLYRRRSTTTNDLRIRKNTKFRPLIVALDVVAIVALVIALVAYGYGGIKPFGLKQLHVPNPTRPLVVMLVAIVIRLCLSYPYSYKGSAKNFITAIRVSETAGLGLIWIVLGFFGSFGLNFVFHRFLFEHIFIFRSIRVPARWAMIAILGLALLAALGARRVSETQFVRRWLKRPALAYVTICFLLLFEARSAPLVLYRGEVDPDPVSLFLAKTPMRGGIVHLPSGVDNNNHRYVLRQADHKRPLITAFSGFVTPTVSQIEAFSNARQIPNEFFDLLEGIPTSYLVIHDWALPSAMKPAIQEMLFRGVSSDRLRFVGTFPGTEINGNEGAQLFAVTKTEPEAKSNAMLPDYLTPHKLAAEFDSDPRWLIVEFDRWSFPLYLFYKTSFHRLPRHDEFVTAAKQTAQDVIVFEPEGDNDLETNLKSFADDWTKRPEFKKAYARRTPAQFVDQLFVNADVTPDKNFREQLITGLQSGTETKASVLLKVISNESVKAHEHTTAIVLLHYFAYLRRNPDDPPDKNWNGFNYWRSEVEKNGDPAALARAFMLSGEYQGIQRK